MQAQEVEGVQGIRVEDAVYFRSREVGAKREAEVPGEDCCGAGGVAEGLWC